MSSPQRLHLVTGKGGVGKTTVATALAVALAKSGQRVLLAEINGGDRVATLLNTTATGYAIREVFDNLWTIDITPQEALKEYVLLIIRIEALYKAVFENRLVSSFLRLLPALGELTMLGKIWYELQQQRHGKPRFDAIVVDLPATGHARALMEAPDAVGKSIPAGPMRDNADRLGAMIRHPSQACLHVVTTPEEMPITEAQELLAFAQQLALPLGALVVNQRIEPLPSEAIAAVQPWREDGALRLWPDALARRQARHERGEALLARMGPALDDAIRLPHVLGGTLSVDDLTTMGQSIMAQWSAKETP